MEQLDDLQLIDLIRTQGDSLAIQELFGRYRPVMLRLRQRYYLPGHELDDWEQEARLVLCTVVRQFRAERSPSFGAFYKLNLTHRVYDLIRQSQAQKRHAQLVSFDAQQTYFADTLVDTRAQVRAGLECQEALQQVLPRLSAVERAVFVELLGNATPEEISRKFGWPAQRVVAALHRCRQKLRQLLAE
ncbi:sigma-70 family RNA polymerase sigma factor [Levilactobacillus zymae]|uniref:sigma-70 family RNA polymerase sigma factor n=1 Tax=Levilactobacillus zymae TaxID=267363 RepID=UPI0028B40C22|nr:sigma-70 family RNA polymerase sigma factor [Levilactobacillus zymae]MDT6980032.1 sigma-70 family RNA polymerase sigma factor [Levilactobacillus zymae]